jgi:GH18 family chitinase
MKKILFLLFLFTTISLSQDSVRVQIGPGDSYERQDWGGGWPPYVKHFIDTVDGGIYKVKFVGQYNVQDNSTDYFGGSSATSYLDFDYPKYYRYRSAISSKQARHWVTGVGSDSTTVTTIMMNYPCDIIIPLIGLNDIANGTRTTAQIAADVDIMIQQAYAVNPGVKILLCNLAKPAATQSSWYDSINAYNAKLPALVAKWKALYKYIRLVDVDTVMNSTTDFSADGHPSPSYGATRNTQGYYHLATAIMPYLKEAVAWDGLPKPSNSIWQMGYITSWDLKTTGASNYGNMPIDSLDITAASHWILFSGGGTNWSGHIDSAATWAGSMSIGDSVTVTGSNFTERIHALEVKAHASNRAVMFLHFLSGSGAGAGNSWQKLSNATSRTNFVSSCLHECLRYRYDGMDFDLEPFSVADTTTAGLFFRELRDSLNTGNYKQVVDPTKNLIFTSVVVGSVSLEFWGRNISIVDKVNYMNYDGMGDWWGQTFHNNAVYSNFPTSDYQIGNATNPITTMTSIIPAMVSAGIPKSKINIGVDFNGWAWTGGTYADGEGTIGVRRQWNGSPATTYAPHRTTAADIQYYDLMHDYFTRLSVDSIHYDAICKVPYMVINRSGSSGDTLVLFQNDSTMFYAAKVMADSGVGSIIWDVPAGFIDRSVYSVPSSPYLEGGDGLLQAMKLGYKTFVGAMPQSSTPADTIIAKVSGDNQSGSTNNLLDLPFTVHLADDLGNNVSGVPISFTIASYPNGATGQNLSYSSVSTNASGNASSTLTLGNIAGTYTVTATLTTATGSPLTFTTIAYVSTATKINWKK